MTAGAWLMLVGVCLSGAISPGPSLLVVVRTTLSSGPYAAILLSLSHALAVGVYASLVVFGLAYLITQSPELMQTLRFAGAAFLLYLAWGAWMGAAQPLLADAIATGGTQRFGHAKAIRDGFLTGLLNPKVLLWFLALFSQFVEPGSGTEQKVGMVVLAVGIDAAWYLLVVWALQSARQRMGFTSWIERNGVRINRCFALLLLLIAVRVLL